MSKLLYILLYLTLVSYVCFGTDIKIEDDFISIIWNLKTQTFCIANKATGRIWQAEKITTEGVDESCTDQYYDITDIVKMSEKSICFNILHNNNKLKCKMFLSSCSVVNLEFEQNNPAKKFCDFTFPFVLKSPLGTGKMFFCDRSCGVYIDQDDPVYKDKELEVYGNIQSLDMPWVGLIDEVSGEGYMVLIETPYDASMKLASGQNELIWPTPKWVNVLGEFGYKRTCSYRFSNSGGYVALAKMYREYVKKSGRLKTLKQKSKERPIVNRLAGAPIIWAGGENCGDVFDFVKEARLRGITKGILSNAEHGLDEKRHVSFKPLNDMGYVTNEYDSIGDFVEGETGFQSDRVDKCAYIHTPVGEPALGWRTLSGMQYYMRSSYYAIRALKKYIPSRINKYHFNGRFMDVAAAIQLFEDYHPEHTFGRKQDMLYRREAIEYFGSLGLLVGSEHINDWAIDIVDYTEGNTSGPFWWESASEGGWNAGHLKNVSKRSDLSKKYLEYGMGVSKRIPLWELVYHDCVVSTWYWGDCSGNFYKVAPELSDRKDLFTILYGSLPILWRNSDIGYDWLNNKERIRFIQTFADTCKVQENVFGSKMLSHEFVIENRMIQKTTFDSGVICYVNFGSEPYRINEKNEECILAPYGYIVRGPNITQSLLIEDGVKVKRILTKDYYHIECDKMIDFGFIKCNGRFTAFEDNSKWYLLFEGKKKRFLIDIKKITRENISDYSIRQLNPNAEEIKNARKVMNSDMLEITPDSELEIYEITFDKV